MKIILCAFITFFCGIIGISAKSKIYKKYQLFAEMNAFLHYITIKIAFFKEIYVDCLYSFVNSQQLENGHIFKSVAKLIESGNFTQNNFNLLIAKYSLSAAEQTQLYNIFANIGATDIDNQKQILQGNIKQLEYSLLCLEKQKKSKADVWGKLGICIGLVISILIY